MDLSLKQQDTEKSLWGVRYVVVTFTFLGCTWFYIINVSFSVALVAMVNISHMSKNESYHESFTPPETNLQNDSTSRTSNLRASDNVKVWGLGEKYDWDLKTQSFLLSALLYGSVPSPLVNGILTQRLGIRWVFGIAGFVCAVLNLITPLAVRTGGATAVIAIRAVQGFLQGGILPVISHVSAFWVPIMEQSRAFGFTITGMYVGTVIGMLVSGYLADSETLGGWPSIFYVFGAIGCLYSVLWMTLVSDYPENHPYVSSKEVSLINEGQKNRKSKDVDFPWIRICTSVPVWSYILSVTGYYAGFVMLMVELPTYFGTVLHFGISKNGAISSTPFVARALLTYVGAYAADALRKCEKCTITTIRKLLSIVGFLGCGIFLFAIGPVGAQTTLIVVLLCLANGATGFLTCGSLMVHVDMCPTFSATLTGISNAFGSLTAAFMPYVAAHFTSSGQTLENWSIVFNISAGISIFCGLQFVVFGSAERQLWDPPEFDGKAGSSKATVKTKSSVVEITKF